MIFARNALAVPAALFLLSLCHGSVRAADPLELDKLPWHLADVFLDLGTHKSVKSISVSYQLFDDIPGGGHSVFLAPIHADLSGVLCYAGTFTHGVCRGTIGDWSTIVHPGHVFRQFGSKSPDRVLPAKDGFSFLSDHEGDLADVSVRGSIKKGVYTIRLEKREKTGLVASKDTCVVDMTVRLADAKESVAVGALVLPQDTFSLDGTVCCFCEIATGWDAKALKWRRAADNPPHGIPHFRYAVGDWQIDDKPVSPKSVSVEYGKAVPQRATVQLRDGCTDQKLLKLLDKKLDTEDTLVISVQEENIIRKGEEVDRMQWDAPSERRKYVVEELKRAK